MQSLLSKTLCKDWNMKMTEFDTAAVDLSGYSEYTSPEQKAKQLPDPKTFAYFV
jgi:hypothetical protein